MRIKLKHFQKSKTRGWIADPGTSGLLNKGCKVASKVRLILVTIRFRPSIKARQTSIYKKESLWIERRSIYFFCFLLAEAV